MGISPLVNQGVPRSTYGNPRKSQRPLGVPNRAWRHNWEDRSLQLEYVYYVYIIYNIMCLECICDINLYIYIIAYYSIYTYMVWRYLKKCMPRNVNRSLTNIMQWHQTTRSHPISSTWRCSSSLCEMTRG